MWTTMTIATELIIFSLVHAHRIDIETNQLRGSTEIQYQLVNQALPLHVQFVLCLPIQKILLAPLFNTLYGAVNNQ